MTKTAEDVTTDFGAIAFQNDFSVVRAKTIKTKDGWRTKVTVHRRDGDTEHLPRGYILGENMLWMDTR